MYKTVAGIVQEFKVDPRTSADIEDQVGELLASNTTNIQALDLFSAGETWIPTTLLQAGASHVISITDKSSTQTPPEHVKFMTQKLPSLEGIKPNSINIIVMRLGPHYLSPQDRITMMNECLRVLVPGGRLIMTAKAPHQSNYEGTPVVDEKEESYTFTRENKTQVRYYMDQRALEKLAEQSHLKVIAADTYDHQVRVAGSKPNKLVTIKCQKAELT